VWFERADRLFSALDLNDLDVYFVTEGARRWSRVSTSGIAAALRVFLRYMAGCGECHPRVGEGLRGPRLYAQESLPSGPAWADVHRLLAHAGGDSPADVRDCLSFYETFRHEKVNEPAIAEVPGAHICSAPFAPPRWFARNPLPVPRWAGRLWL
jgi:hypothetical protein